LRFHSVEKFALLRFCKSPLLALSRFCVFNVFLKIFNVFLKNKRYTNSVKILINFIENTSKQQS